MGYDIHITRAEDWTESEATPILLEEWLALARSDPEMRVDSSAEATTTQGETIRYENPGVAVWTGYSKDGEGGNHAWFDHRSGEIVVKNPDQEILRKMGRIAKRLGAKVQGDEREFYDEDGCADN